MVKTVAKLLRDPFRVGLTDRTCSVFIDPKAGTILIDEGAGDDRLNGAVMYPDKSPRFSVAAASESDKARELAKEIIASTATDMTAIAGVR